MLLSHGADFKTEPDLEANSSKTPHHPRTEPIRGENFPGSQGGNGTGQKDPCTFTGSEGNSRGQTSSTSPACSQSGKTKTLALTALGTSSSPLHLGPLQHLHKANCQGISAPPRKCLLSPKDLKCSVLDMVLSCQIRRCPDFLLKLRRSLRGDSPLPNGYAHVHLYFQV